MIPGKPLLKGSREALAGAGVSPVIFISIPLPCEEGVRGWLAQNSTFSYFFVLVSGMGRLVQNKENRNP
jgi:hypothetical protein